MKNTEAETVPTIETFSEDGRLPLQRLNDSFAQLKGILGWKAEPVFTQIDARDGRKDILPVTAFRTPFDGKAIWVIAGIHGEEPAGPNAIARNLEVFATLNRLKIPAVVFPLCNPLGYVKDYRYPNEYRDPRKGRSVGDTDHAVPHLEYPDIPAKDVPTSEAAFLLTQKMIELWQTHPPLLTIDFHEDEDLRNRLVYLYSQGGLGPHDPIAQDILTILKESGMPLKLSGDTKWGEPIRGGIVSERDLSIDDLLASKLVFHRGDWIPGPAAHSVVVTEIPTIGIPLDKRVESFANILARLPLYWNKLQNTEGTPNASGSGW